MLLSRGLRLTHLAIPAQHIRALRTDPYRLHPGRCKHAHVLVGDERATVVTLSHTYELNNHDNIVFAEEIAK
jgi:hypothetical protein